MRSMLWSKHLCCENLRLKAAQCAMILPPNLITATSYAENAEKSTILKCLTVSCHQFHQASASTVSTSFTKGYAQCAQLNNIK